MRSRRAFNAGADPTPLNQAGRAIAGPSGRFRARGRFLVFAHVFVSAIYKLMNTLAAHAQQGANLRVTHSALAEPANLPNAFSTFFLRSFLKRHAAFIVKIHHMICHLHD